LSKYIRILSLDGGGIRGIIPAQILVRLEQVLQKRTGNTAARIADFFDLVAGTSTGGILTCLYLCPGVRNSLGSGRPRYSAQEAINGYLEYGPQIFKNSFFHHIFSFFGLLDQKYSDKNLVKYLEFLFGDTKLSELLKPCLITAYNIEKRYAHFFTQHDARQRIEYDYLVKDVARATSAAPTYFEPIKVHSLANKYFSLIDGGVIANNPSLLAFSEAWRELKGHPTIKEMVILSLGTGDDEKPIQYQKAKGWGDIGWIDPIINILMSGNAETVDYQLKTIFLAAQKEEQYLRINAKLPKSMVAIDNAQPNNMKNLVDFGSQIADRYQAQLEEIVKLLIANGGLYEEPLRREIKSPGQLLFSKNRISSVPNNS
jgi:patatin-like phospholipase/acyl hydrolase